MQRGLIKLLAFIKIRTFARSREELWLDEWKNPLARDVEIGDPNKFLESLQRPLTHDGYACLLFCFAEILKNTFARCYLDRIPTGFLTWSPSIKGYMPVPNDESPLSWEPESLPCLDVIREGINEEGYIDQLAILWSQESGKSSNTLDVRSENPLFFKYLCMWSLKSSLYCLFKENPQPRCLVTKGWMKFF